MSVTIGFDVATGLLRPLAAPSPRGHSPRRTLGEPSGEETLSPRGNDSRERLREYDALPEVIDHACGRAVAASGEPFDCVLHRGIGQARVELRESKVAYVCDCVDDRDFERSLTEVYVTRLTGVPRKRGKPEYVRWKYRLLIEAGVVDAPGVILPPLPPNASRSAVAVYEGLRLFVQVRLLTDTPGDPFPFARGFAAEWCDLDREQARAGISAVVSAGVLEKVDTVPSGAHEAYLYVVGMGSRDR